jgi:hypothetical protein
VVQLSERVFEGVSEAPPPSVLALRPPPLAQTTANNNYKGECLWNVYITPHRFLASQGWLRPFRGTSVSCGPISVERARSFLVSSFPAPGARASFPPNFVDVRG